MPDIRSSFGDDRFRTGLPFRQNIPMAPEDPSRPLADGDRDGLERSASEAAEGDAFYRMMVESSTDFAMFTLDMDGRITSWNTGSEKTFGFLSSEAIGRDTSIIFTPEDAGEGVPYLEIRDALEKGRAIDRRWHIRKNGSRFWADGVLLPLRDSLDRVRGFLKILRDAGEQLDLQMRLDRSEEEVVRLRRERDGNPAPAEKRVV
jgi:PAS domain S-box-containing protein